MLDGLVLDNRVVANHLFRGQMDRLNGGSVKTSMFNAVIRACGLDEAIRERACRAVRQASASGVSWAPKGSELQFIDECEMVPKLPRLPDWQMLFTIGGQI
jgi:hypothetical protein